TLKRLRDLGNSVLVVEHDEDMIRAADHCIDLGPGAGVHGGEVVAQGTPQQVAAHATSLTGQFLSGRRRIALPARRTPWQNAALIEGATLPAASALRSPRAAGSARATPAGPSSPAAATAAAAGACLRVVGA